MSAKHALALAMISCASVAGASCDPQRGAWGLDAIRTMQTPADDPSLGCGAQLPPDTAAARRASCAFGAGARASETLGVDRAALARIPIRHVIVLMKENRSFDHVFGKLHDRGAPDVEPIPPGWSNPDERGAPVPATRATTTCIPFDPGHQSTGMAAGVNGGKMDGFVKNAARTTKSDGSFAMQYYDEPELPFQYWLGRTFAIADRDFAPMLTGPQHRRAQQLAERARAQREDHQHRHRVDQHRGPQRVQPARLQLPERPPRGAPDEGVDDEGQGRRGETRARGDGRHPLDSR